MNTLNILQQKAWSPMTAFLAFASLLVVAVFAVGCSDQNLSVLSPDNQGNSSKDQIVTASELEQLDTPLLAKPSGSSEATYRVTFSGDISGGPEEVTKTVKPTSSGVGINPITLDISYFQTALAGGGNCFSLGEYSGPLQLYKKKNTADIAQSFFYFWSSTSDGVTEIKYYIDMRGTITDPNNWPPAAGTQNTVIITDWEMANGAKKKDRKAACLGEGTFNSGVTVLVERIS